MNDLIGEKRLAHLRAKNEELRFSRLLWRLLAAGEGLVIAALLLRMVP